MRENKQEIELKLQTINTLIYVNLMTYLMHSDDFYHYCLIA